MRLLVVGSNRGTAAAVVLKALARGHRVTPRDAVNAVPAGYDAIVGDETLAAADVRRVIEAAREGRAPGRVVLIAPAETEIVVESGLEWTIARVPALTDGGLSVQYRIAAGRLPPRARPISRLDVAHFVVKEVERARHVRAIVGVSR